MIRAWLKPFLIVALVFTLGTPPALSFTAQESGDYLAQRTKLLSYLIRQQLTNNHYSQKQINDELSLAAFDLYLKQLDFQKRFLLKKDIARLRSFGTRIDDEINQGVITLPRVSADIMNQRIALVKSMVGEILAEDFDFTLKEGVETDPEKLEYCDDIEGLRDRWRKALKYQVLSRYLNLLEDEEDAESSPAKADDPERTPEALLLKAREKVLKSHEDFFSRMLSETEQDHYDRYFNVVTRAFDPHTNYLPPRQKEDFDISMRGSLEGIGATLKEEDGYIKVVQIIPGSAAYRQGQLHAEDIILAVAQAGGEPVDITDTRIRDAVSLIRGKKGTVVSLTVKKPDGSRLVVPIVRDVVQIEESFVKSTTLTDEESGRTYGYIKIPAFYRDFEKTQNGGKGRNSTDDVRAELIKLKAGKVDGLVLDLRNNGGGALTDAVAITGLFIDTGPVVQVRNSNGKTQVLSDEEPGVEYDGPIVVLVNQFSASASEILAGALQDYGRAVVLGGEHTHGKGTVQAMIDLNYRNAMPNMEKYSPLGALKVTIQKFYRVSGGSTQYRGVVPDIILPDRLKHLKTGEQYIDYSLPWDTVSSVKYQRWSEKGIDLGALKANSERRVTADEEFIEVAEAARRAGEKMEQTLQSLNIDDLRRERDEAKRFGDKTAEGETPHPDRGDDAAGKAAEEWLKAVKEDPYAGEAMAVLGDILLMTDKDKVSATR
jgi:carboxyl-terminal processing protease